MVEDSEKSAHRTRKRWTMAVLVALVLSGVVPRLYRINLPLFDGHGYRQHGTAAIARNFYDESMNILYPRVDWRGDSTGYVEADFQIYTYLVAALYHLFGPEEWVGRGLNIVVYVLSAFLLFAFARRLFDDRAALFAVAFYCFMPLSMIYSRSFQPDAIMALGSLAAIAFFCRWLDDRRTWALIASALGLSVAVLVKPHSLYLGLPILYLSVRNFGWRFLVRPAMWFLAAAAVVPAVLWYAHAYQLWLNHGNTLGIFGRPVTTGFWPLNDPHWHWLGNELMQRLTYRIATPVGLLFLVVGLLAPHSPRGRVLLWWVIGFVICILLVPKPHWGHDYYQLPIVFAAAAYMGFGVMTLLDKAVFSRVTVAVLLLCALGLSALEMRGKIRIREADKVRIPFNSEVKVRTDSDDLVIFVVPRPAEPFDVMLYRHRTSEGEDLYCDPRDFYNSHRKGWSIDEVQATPDFVETLRRRGARCFATVHPKIFERHPDLKTTLDDRYTPLDVNDRWAIYRLEAPPTEGGSG